MKKIINLFLVVLMLFGTFTNNVYAEGETVITDEFTVTFENDSSVFKYGSVKIVCKNADLAQSFNSFIITGGSLESSYANDVNSGDVNKRDIGNNIIYINAGPLGESSNPYTVVLVCNVDGTKTRYQTTFSVNRGGGEDGGGDDGGGDVQPPEGLKIYPTDINVEINADGDLLITSADTGFINDLVKNYGFDDNGIIGESKDYYKDPETGEEGIPYYYFEIHNGYIDESTHLNPLKKVNDTTVKFAVEDQLYSGEPSQVLRGQVLNGAEYILYFCLPGYAYGPSDDGRKKYSNDPIVFTKANIPTPTEHVKAYLTDGYLILSSDDTGSDFLKNYEYSFLAKLNKKGYIDNFDTDTAFAEEELTVNDYDTISSTNNKVFRIDSSKVTNPGEWTALVFSYGYGRYCFDGRKFGGIVDISVEPFKVNLRGLNDTITDTDDVIGLYTLPAISPVSGKEVKGWRIKDKNNDVLRCIGEEIFVASDTEIYAIYDDIPVPEKIETEDIIASILANTVNKINIATNAFGATINNDSFITDAEKAQGVAIWVETDILDENSDEYEQILRVLTLDEKEDTFVSAVDINVFKQVGTDSKAIKITETDNYIEISLDLSSDERAQKLAEEGRIGLFSIHEGRPTEIVRGTYDTYTRRYTVRLNKFSTFAFIEAETDPKTVINTRPGSSGSKSSYIPPKTGVE